MAAKEDMMKTIRIKVDQVKWDPSVYPRSKWSTSTIDRYAEALQQGAQFPPIVINKADGRLLDGKHRLEAHRKAEIQEIEAVEEVVPDGVPIKVFAASLSAKHGDRLQNVDAKALAREVATSNPEYDMKTIAELLSFKYSTVASWVADIVAKNREQRMAWVRRLRLLGWTQGEIGQALGWSERHARRVGHSSRPEEMSGSDTPDAIEGLLASGLSAQDVAKRLEISLQLATAIDFNRQGLDDRARLKALGINIQPYDVWHFQGCHDLMGDRHPGRIPGELVAHVLYFYTKAGALVIDPMAGSGTTSDTCLLLGRRCYSYDIDLRHQRPDILRNDLAKDGWPDRTAKADLILWDPPCLDRKAYLEFSGKALAGARQKVKAGAVLAVLASDLHDHDGTDDGLSVGDYAEAVAGAGWTLTRHIQCPVPKEEIHPDVVSEFRESRRLAKLGRYLLMARA